jgi:hypothetical protein
MSVNRNVQFVFPFDDVNWSATRVRHEKFWADADHMDDTVPFCYSITDISFTQNTHIQHTKQDK